jgi:ferritin
MLSPKIEAALNQQVGLEADSSQIYLAMASWAEVEGYEGISAFLYHHSDSSMKEVDMVPSRPSPNHR